MPYNGSFDLSEVHARLPGRRIDWYCSIGSTMTAAAELARQGCAPGTIVGADEQTAGIGRQGHAWHSVSGEGLYASFILESAAGNNAIPLIMLALGLAVQEGIAQTSGLAPDLRWPNDVLLSGKKCAGILAQMESGSIIAGIGINVGHKEFPEDLHQIATSLARGKARVRREDLLVALVRAIDENLGILKTKGASTVLDMFTRASSYAIGRRVTVDQPGGTVEGVTCGLDASGFLRIRQDNGVEATILAGGVRPA
jgi:BirA family biotin operon repressor/biotin-[acetyl-CoA-carboxylase] ligase